ncbi:MAG: AAA family ATPase [Nitrospira sp.]|nr:AAA family ATPase [Nitrospira sp.]
MKLLKLLLRAYGPFTGKVLDFSTGPANLHLIYGPNEAGKSSALRAMMDLRFGIPVRSPDDFLHAAGDLRIGGIFATANGEPIGFVRRKGKGATLARLNVLTEHPDQSLVIEPGHERGLTGGLERAEFEAMFGLTPGRLREGGKVLLRGEGDLGSALFEASAGTGGIAALLAALENDAKKLYSPHGRAQNAVINEARRRLDEQRQAWREAQTKPAEWQSLNRAHEAAAAALADVGVTLERLRRRENELTELRTVEPLLHTHDAAAVQLASCAGIPDLPEQAREERLAALQELNHAERSLREAEVETERCAHALGALVLEPLVLEHAGAIERLVSGVTAAARHRIEVQQQGAVIAALEANLGLAVARLAPGHELRDVLQALPSSADRLVLDDHLMQVSRLHDRLDHFEQRARALDQALAADHMESPLLSDHASRQQLVTAIRGAQSLGDVVRRRKELDDQRREMELVLEQALSDVGLASDQALRRAQPLLDAQIAHTRRELTDLDEQIRKLRDEQELLGRDLDGQRLRLRQLAAEGEVVTAETLRQARAKRDERWSAIRQAYIDQTQRPDQLSLGFDTGRAIPDMFEAALSEADRQADLLRADAKRAAGLEECAGRIEQMEARRSDIERQMARLSASRGTTLAAWAQRLKDAGLPDLAPEALREWQGRRAEALQIAERVAGLRAASEQLKEETKEAAVGIRAALLKLGQSVGEPNSADVAVLPSLIEQAVAYDTKAVEAEAAYNAKEQAAKVQRMERQELDRSMAEIEADVRRRQSALQEWHARLFLASDTLPAAIKVRLDELDDMARQAAALGEATQRKTQVQAILDDLTAQSKEVAALLGAPAPQIVEDFADRLRGRIAAARVAEQERTTLLREQRKAEEKRRRAASDQAAQQAILARLCTTAGVANLDELPRYEESALRKREAAATLTQVRQQIAAASSHSVEELRRRLSGRDAVTLETEREQCRSEITIREEEQATARRAEEQARLALNAIDSSDLAARSREAMESAAARYRSAIRPWARLRLARALLQEALNRFRERAQAPMITKASAYFALMTDGDYERLISDDTGGQPRLCALRPGGAPVSVEEMSEGTADQLYLALRLAALDVRRAAHPQMPLVLDDALMTSDDRRVAHILRALVRFAEEGQVLIFTHHRHLLDVARAALGEQAFVAHHL